MEHSQPILSQKAPKLAKSLGARYHLGVTHAEHASPKQHRSAPILELRLSRDVFATGRRLSGIVVVRLARQTGIRSLVVAVTGVESPVGAPLASALRGRGVFFEREVLLSGRDQPRLASDRASQLWKAFLGRERGRLLGPGEHTYPFSIPLPASLPPSYRGRAGRLDYRVLARMTFLLGGSQVVSKEARVALVPRDHRVRPVALSYPTLRPAAGPAHSPNSSPGPSVHSSEVTVQLELPQRTAPVGGRVGGRFVVSNPQGIEIPQARVSLEACEWVKLGEHREIHREVVDSCSCVPGDPRAVTFEADFEMLVPENAIPTVEGTSIAVTWLLKLSVGSTPPLEFKTPITVYTPVDGLGQGSGSGGQEARSVPEPGVPDH